MIIRAFAVVAAVLAVLVWSGALALRRQSWTLAGTVLAAGAVVFEAARRGQDELAWVVPFAVLVVLGGELTRLGVDSRRRGTARVIERGVGRSAVGGTVVVLVVVVLASGCAALVVGGTRSPAGLIPVAVAMVAVAVVISAVVQSRAGRLRQPARRPAVAVAAAVAALVVATVTIGAAAEATIPWRGGSAAVTDTAATRQAGDDNGSVADLPSSTARPDRTPVDAGRLSGWAAIVLAGAFIVVLVVFGRREQLFPPEDLQPDRLVRGGIDPSAEAPTPVRTVDRAVTMATMDEALVGLRSDADPRVAVRVAYATVARGLGRAELGRRASETEGEYLTRALGAVGAGGAALRRLTELFAVARFSDDPVDEAMRAEALSALEQIRAQVASNGPVVSG